jgi:hypothetical protein
MRGPRLVVVIRFSASMIVIVVLVVLRARIGVGVIGVDLLVAGPSGGRCCTAYGSTTEVEGVCCRTHCGRR